MVMWYQVFSEHSKLVSIRGTWYAISYHRTGYDRHDLDITFERKINTGSCTIPVPGTYINGTWYTWYVSAACVETLV